MKIFRYFLLLFMVSFLSCNNDDDLNILPQNNCLMGQGTIVSETRSLPTFHSVVNTVFADVLITQGPEEDIIIEAQQNILQELNTRVVNGELRITVDRCIDINQAIKVHITIPEIRNLALTGVGDMIAQNNFDVNNLRIALTGVGDFVLKGTTTSLDIALTGVGNVRSFQLISTDCDVLISGTGDAEVFVNHQLNVIITGTGSVFYKGNPLINSTITGIGSVVDAN